jgi:thiaminase/transcriptional activator TenA
MKFSDFLWQSIQLVYQAILQHPFIHELQQGRLSQTVFSYYLQQDALYLD